MTLTRATALGPAERVENAATTPARLDAAASRAAMVDAIIFILSRLGQNIKKCAVEVQGPFFYWPLA